MRLALWLVPVALAAALCAALVRAARSPARHAGPWRAALARLIGDRLAVAALFVLCVFVMVAALAPWLAPYAPTDQLEIIQLKSQPPSAEHPFGTDQSSRDVLSRVLYGARVSLTVGTLAVLLSITIGTAYGAVAGFYGGSVDELMMRALEAAVSVPRVLLLIAVLAMWGAVPVWALVLLIGFTGWFGVSRQVRAQVLALKEQEMMFASRALGAADARILVHHILPNVLSPVIVAATLGVGNVIVLEAGLAYLGLGLRVPSPSWGNIIQDASEEITALWWMSLFPGLAILITVMAFNILGDGLRDALDPRQVVES